MGGKHTPAQRQRENEARKAARAAAKAPAVPKGKPAAPKKAAVRNTSKAIREAKARRAELVERQRKIPVVGSTKPNVRETLKLKAIAEHKDKVLLSKKAKEELAAGDPVVKDFLAKATGMVQVQKTAPPAHTMARSYVRKTGAGKGVQRTPGSYQCTVAFTAQQRDWLAAKAAFRLVSLAEMVRICVVERMSRPDGSST